MIITDEDLPYRAAFTLPNRVSEPTANDEIDYSTLKAVRSELRAAIMELDKWSAFDSKETELKVKQQIVAHKMVYEIVSPLLAAVETAMYVVDDKFKKRNNSQ